MQVAIIGKGLFGSAIGSLLEHNAIPFRYVDIDLPMEHVADIVIIATPTQHLRSALIHNREWFAPHVQFINVSKGIEQHSHLLPHQIIAELFADSAYYCLMGPSFADDLKQAQPTILNLGCLENPPSNELLKLFKTPYCAIMPTSDLVAIEYMAALKNVYAILCGFAAGIGFGPNTQARLITLALQESVEYIKACGYSLSTAVQPGIVGDLFMTCSSSNSRNFSFGALLAHHLPHEALAKINATVEGYYTSASIQALVEAHKVPLPLATLTHVIIEQGKEARGEFDRVLIGQ